MIGSVLSHTSFNFKALDQSTMLNMVCRVMQWIVNKSIPMYHGILNVHGGSVFVSLTTSLHILNHEFVFVCTEAIFQNGEQNYNVPF